MSCASRPSRITPIRSASASSSGSSEGYDQHGRAASGEAPQRLWISDLGADVDAARRLVEKNSLRAGGEPAGDDHLLLIAAREVPHECIRAGGRIRAPRCSA